MAVADLYPRFTLRGTFGVETVSGAGPGTGGALLDASSFFYQIGAGLLYPVFNYGRIKNQVRVQDAAFQQALVDYQQTVLKATQEVEDGLAGFLRSQEAVVFAANAVRSAQRSVDLALVQYREGAVDYQRVLDAQRSLLLQQNSMVQTHSSVATNLIALYKALGGGWELRQGQPFVPDRTVTEMRNRTDWGDLFARPPAENTVNQTENTVNQVSAPPR
jgi:outer membrane protein TolC